MELFDHIILPLELDDFINQGFVLASLILFQMLSKLLLWSILKPAHCQYIYQDHGCNTKQYTNVKYKHLNF